MDKNQNNGGSAPTEPVAPEAPAQQPAPAEQAAPAAEPAVPTETRDRTRDQFEKLLESNKRLFEANELLRTEMEQRRTTSQSNPTNSVPQYQQQPGQNTVNPNDFVEKDPISGEPYINEQRLRARIEEIQQRASRAEQAIESYAKASEQREIQTQNREAYTSYPQLDPYAEQFNPVFNKQVRGILTDSFNNPDEYNGRPLSFKEAADFVKAQNQPAPEATDPAAIAEAEAKTKEAQTLKEQATSQAVGQQPQGQRNTSDDDELTDLRYRTKYLNDDAALAQRIMHTEHIVPKGDES